MTAFSGSEEEEEAGGGGEAERREGENSALVEQTSPHTDSGGSLDTRLVWGVGGDGEGGGVLCTAYCLHSCMCCGRLV